VLVQQVHGAQADERHHRERHQGRSDEGPDREAQRHAGEAEPDLEEHDVVGAQPRQRVSQREDRRIAGQPDVAELGAEEVGVAEDVARRLQIVPGIGGDERRKVAVQDDPNGDDGDTEEHGAGQRGPRARALPII
jgi:hypothetical protein